MRKNNRCSVSGCNEEHYITYYTYPVCLKHWNKHCNATMLKKLLKIKENTIKGVL